MADRFGGIEVDDTGADRFGGAAVAEPSAAESAQQVATGVNEGLAEFLGIPVDIVNSAMSAIPSPLDVGRKLGLNIPTAEDLGFDQQEPVPRPSISEPFAGSESLKKLLDKAGVMRPELPGFEAERRIGKEIGAAIPMISGVGAVAKGAQLATTGAKTLGRTMLEPAIQRPARTAAGEVVAATTSGTGAAIMQRVAPGDVGAEMTGQIAGGIAPSLTPTGLAVKAGRALTKRFAPSAQRQAAREKVQDLLGREITEDVGRKIVAGQEVAGQVPGLQPSLAEVSGSPSLIQTQRAREGRLYGEALEQAVTRHERNVTAINDFAESVSPTGSLDVDVVIDRAGKKVTGLLEDIQGARPSQVLAREKPSLSNIGAQMRDDLIERRRDASAAMSDMADDMGLNDVDITPQFDEIREDLIDVMTPTGRFARDEYAPDVVKTLIDDRKVNVPTSLEDLKLLRESMGEDLRSLVGGTAPDMKQARYLKMGIKQLDDAMDQMVWPENMGEKYQQFRQAYYDTVITPFERGAAFKVKQKGTRGHYVTDDERVAHTFFGPKKESDMAQFVGVFGDDPKQMDAMRSVIMDDFQAAVVRDGEIKPRLMERWLDRFSGTLNQIPGVRDELGSISTANQALQKRLSSLDVRQRQIEDAILTKKLKPFAAGTKSGDSVVSDAIQNPRLMRQLTNRLRGDDEALTSLRRHVWDDVISNDTKTMRANIEANKESLTAALGKKHMDNIDTVLNAREMIERVPIPRGQELQVGPLRAVEKHVGMSPQAVASRVYAIKSGRIGKSYMLTEMASRFLRGQSAQDMERLMDTALYDPELAKDLADAIRFPASVPVKNKMKKHLFNLGMGGEENE